MTAPCTTGIPPITGFKTMWLGKAGSMVALRMPDAGMQMGRSRAEVAHGLSSGGTAVTRRDRARRAYTFLFSGMTPDDLDYLNAVYLGVYGSGPWLVADPTMRNQLPTDASVCGRKAGTTTLSDFVASGSGTAIYDSSVAPFTLVPRSGVIRWPGAGSSGQLVASTTSSPDATKSNPVLPGVAHCGSAYVATASSTASVSLVLRTMNLDGSGATDTVLQTVTATTTPQRIGGATTPAANSTVPYAVLVLKCNTVGAPNILTAGWQLEYGVSAPGAFVVGERVARCSFNRGPAESAKVYWRRDTSYTLAEL